MIPSKYESPHKTGDNKEDIEALFRAVYKIAQNLNKDISALSREINSMKEGE